MSQPGLSWAGEPRQGSRLPKGGAVAQTIDMWQWYLTEKRPPPGVRRTTKQDSKLEVQLSYPIGSASSIARIHWFNTCSLSIYYVPATRWRWDTKINPCSQWETQLVLKTKSQGKELGRDMEHSLILIEGLGKASPRTWHLSRDLNKEREEFQAQKE